MDLFEYQARDLFAKHDVPVLAGEVIDTPEAARAATERLGGKSVVKAQVKVGGRGKAGGVKLAATPDEAVEHATNILGMDIKGHTVHKVMIAETAPEIVEEYYVSFLLDRANRTFLSIASVEGGMEIEEVAATRPEAVAKTPIDANVGVTPEVARGIVEAANFPAEVADKVADILVTLWKTFIEEDALLVVAPQDAPDWWRVELGPRPAITERCRGPRDTGLEADWVVEGSAVDLYLTLWNRAERPRLSGWRELASVTWS